MLFGSLHLICGDMWISQRGLEEATVIVSFGLSEALPYVAPELRGCGVTVCVTRALGLRISQYTGGIVVLSSVL